MVINFFFSKIFFFFFSKFDPLAKVRKSSISVSILSNLDQSHTNGDISSFPSKINLLSDTNLLSSQNVLHTPKTEQRNNLLKI